MARNPFIDFLKGLLITLVVIGHAIQYVSYHGDANYFANPLFKLIYIFHMPLFMAIGGYLSHRSLGGTGFFALARSRFHAYIAPIFVWGGLYTVVTTLFGTGARLTNAPSTWVGHIFSLHLWFLWVLFVSIVLTGAILRARSCFWAAYALSTVLVWMLPEDGILFLLKFLYPFFQVGYAFAHISPRIPWSRYQRLITPLSALTAAAAYVLWSNQTYIYVSGMGFSVDTIGQIGLRYVGGLFMAATFVALMATLYKHIQGAGLTRLVEKLGRDSMLIYVLQSYALYLVWHACHQLPVRPDGSVAWVAGGVVLGGVLTLLFWVAGTILCRSALFARILFGKTVGK